MRILAALSIIAVSLPWAAAQESVPDTSEPLRRYAVEVIVFRYAEDVAVGSEVFPPDEPDPLPDSEFPGSIPESTDRGTVPADVPAVIAPDASEAGENMLNEDEQPSQNAHAVLLLDEEFTLQRVARQLELLDVYEPLLHVGWTQVAHGERDAPALDLPFFGEPVEGLEGSFTLYLGRYLHLVVDLALDAAPGQEETGARPAEEAAFSFGDERFVYEDEPPRDRGRVQYRINENRILRNGDIRYFDHPRFGVIAKVSRVEVEKEGDGAAVGRTPSIVGRR